MNHLPPCILWIKPGELYYFMNDLHDYEFLLDKYIVEMKKSSIPILFTKTQVLDIVKKKRQTYYETLNESLIKRTQRDLLCKEKELPETYKYPDSFYLTFVLRVAL